jgi:hypothetical protein
MSRRKTGVNSPSRKISKAVKDSTSQPSSSNEQALAKPEQPEADDGLSSTAMAGNPNGFLSLEGGELGRPGVPDMEGVAGYTSQEDLELSYSAPTTNTVKVEERKGTLGWGMHRIPDFKGLRALVLPGAFYGAIVGLMAESGCTKASSLDECDLVVFAGGADVNPALYNERAMACTTFSQSRDQEEVRVYHTARRLGLPMFGICRGAQFLHVMNGGQLWQNVNNPCRSGPSHI